MNRKWFSMAGLVVVATLLLTLSNCARNQHLQSIQVVPAGATFEGVGAQIQFRAFGTYIHPPATKDITDKVQWSIDSQNLANITSPGLVTSTSICGSGNGGPGHRDLQPGSFKRSDLRSSRGRNGQQRTLGNHLPHNLQCDVQPGDRDWFDG